jgi:putative mRNA 3-end processing factor
MYYIIANYWVYFSSFSYCINTCIVLIEFTDKGFYCAQGNFYIDPWRAVQNAIITHAHSDHARYGNNVYIAHHDTVPLLKARLGAGIQTQGYAYYETFFNNGVAITLYPAGHIIGSAQIKIEYKGEVWVISGDYKIEVDGVSTPFEPVTCNYFISESTFGLPVYNWKPQATIFNDIQQWVTQCHALQRTPILYAYSLGKAQRLIQHLHKVVPNIYVHGAVFNMQEAIKQTSVNMPDVTKIDAVTDRNALLQGLVIAPGSVDGSGWFNKLIEPATGMCSGWMQSRGAMRRYNVDAGFVLSDHADWNGLIESIKATKCEKVFLTHGFTASMSRYLNETGIAADEVKTQFAVEDNE